MLHLFLITVVLVAFAVICIAIGVIIKGKFPETHAGCNPEMKKLGITCAKRDAKFCQGRVHDKFSTNNKCSGCNLSDCDYETTDKNPQLSVSL